MIRVMVIQRRLLVGAACAVVLAGCSNPPPPTPPPGSLSAGTAEVTINGARVDTTHDVNCSSQGAVMTIETGDDTRGTTSAVDTAEGIAVQFAEIRDLGGFTGGYWARLGPATEVEVAGQTFLMNGTATGFNEANPSARISAPFSIRVAC